MPARMWKHAIHAFLEVLRHRRPDSQDYMLAFIYLAYQMMALLFETVPSFLDTWIECLGDLARYRMAIEEEREAHATWGAVAGRWYRMAADRNPGTGRLNHHLGILERPSLRKLYLYTKALSCVVPFVNAKDSMATLCGPIVQDQQVVHQKNETAEVQLVTVFALLFSSCDENATESLAKNALTRLGALPSSKLSDIGPDLVVTSVGFLLELGASTNGIWQLFAKAMEDSYRMSRPSTQAATGVLPPPSPSQLQSSLVSTFARPLVYRICQAILHSLIRHRKDRHSTAAALSSVHAVLVWLYGVFRLCIQTNDDRGSNTCSSLLNPDAFTWGELSIFLNSLSTTEPIAAETIEFARNGEFPTPDNGKEAQLLSEDFLLRGLMWTQFYYPDGFFDGSIDDNGRAIETPSMHKARVVRVQWLALYLAFRTKYLGFDVNTRCFYVHGIKPIESLEHPLASRPLQYEESQSAQTSRSSTTVGSDSDGYEIVSSARKKLHRSRRSRTSNSTSKSKRDNSTVKIVDDEMVEWGC